MKMVYQYLTTYIVSTVKCRLLDVKVNLDVNGGVDSMERTQIRDNKHVVKQQQAVVCYNDLACSTSVHDFQGQTHAFESRIVSGTLHL